MNNEIYQNNNYMTEDDFFEETLEYLDNFLQEIDDVERGIGE